MPIQNYGVLKGRAFERKRGTSQSEHFQILINRDNNPHRIAINTKSSEAPSQVLYFADDDFKHEISNALLQANLPFGFSQLDSVPGQLALDFIRRNLVTRDQMTPLPSQSPGADDDLNDKLDFFVQQAIHDPTAILYAFGQHWQDENKKDKYFAEINPSTGIHDIHMNQGNPAGKYFKDNGPWQDGGLLFHYASRNRWAAVFTAFQTQAFHTDDATGHPLEGIPVVKVDKKVVTDNNIQPENRTPVRIIAAMVNPHGGTPENEYLILLNKSDKPVNLNGWKILDKQQKTDVITDKMIAAGDTLRISLTGLGAQLSNKGGIITLLNKDGIKIDGVSYTKEDAANEGEVIEL